MKIGSPLNSIQNSNIIRDSFLIGKERDNGLMLFCANIDQIDVRKIKAVWPRNLGMLDHGVEPFGIGYPIGWLLTVHGAAPLKHFPAKCG